jgi:CubicO group peptidase (beta-lactamase class C family)
MDSFSHPLVFEPGTSWRYGPGLDWAGLVVVRLTKMGLESYMQQNIFSPLGIHNLTFWPDKHPEMASRRASSSLRDPESGKALPFSVEASAELRDEFGGKGLHGTAPSYLKILHSILRDDERLLTKESTAMMFQPQLTEASQRVLQEDFDIIGTPKCIGYYIGLYPKARYDWGLGGVLSVEDSSADGHDWRRRGCLSWSGALNLFWVSRTLSFPSFVSHKATPEEYMN